MEWEQFQLDERVIFNNNNNILEWDEEKHILYDNGNSTRETRWVKIPRLELLDHWEWVWIIRSESNRSVYKWNHK